ncbi:MAG: hypothetical protein ACLSAF_20545 [Intestinimonas sp.]
MVLVSILGGLINSAWSLCCWCVLFWDWRIGLLALAGTAVLSVPSSPEWSKQSATDRPRSASEI